MNVTFTQFPYGKYVLVICFVGFAAVISQAQSTQNLPAAPKPASTVTIAQAPSPPPSAEKPKPVVPPAPKGSQHQDGIIIDIIDITRQD